MCRGSWQRGWPRGRPIQSVGDSVPSRPGPRSLGGVCQKESSCSLHFPARRLPSALVLSATAKAGCLAVDRGPRRYRGTWGRAEGPRWYQHCFLVSGFPVFSGARWEPREHVLARRECRRPLRATLTCLALLAFPDGQAGQKVGGAGGLGIKNQGVGPTIRWSRASAPGLAARLGGIPALLSSFSHHPLLPCTITQGAEGTPQADGALLRGDRAALTQREACVSLRGHGQPLPDSRLRPGPTRAPSPLGLLTGPWEVCASRACCPRGAYHPNACAGKDRGEAFSLRS